MGCLTPVRGLKEETAALMRRGSEYLPDEAQRVYDAGLPNFQTIHTEAPITAFLNRKRIVSLFDSLELEKRDTVVMAKSVYKILTMYRKNRAKYSDGPECDARRRFRLHGAADVRRYRARRDGPESAFIFRNA